MYNGTDALKFALKFLYSTRQKLNRTKQIGNSALLKSWTKKWNRRGEKKKKKRKNQGTATTEKMLSIRGKNPRDSYLGRNLPTQPLLCDLTSWLSYAIQQQVKVLWISMEFPCFSFWIIGYAKFIRRLNLLKK